MEKFPELKGPGPILWAILSVLPAAAAIYFFSGRTGFLLVNAALLGLVLFTIIRGFGYISRKKRSLLLAGTLLLLLGLFAFYENFEQVELYYAYIFIALGGLLIYLARRTYAISYGVKESLEAARPLDSRARIEFAETCRTKFRKKYGALQVAARIYQDAAKEALHEDVILEPFHLIAMQKYAHMILYGETPGLRGEGEWYAKKAKVLARVLLKDSGPDKTVH